MNIISSVLKLDFHFSSFFPFLWGLRRELYKICFIYLITHSFLLTCSSFLLNLLKR